MLDLFATPDRKTPREHQSRTIERIRQSLAGGKSRPCVCLPVGAGKTFLASMMVAGAVQKGNRVIFTVPALSLIGQTLEAFEDEGLDRIGVIQADHPRADWVAPVQIASVQTLARRDRPDCEMVIVDEAHIGSKVIADWMAECPNVKFIGLSATPWRKGMAAEYDDLIIGATTQELIDKGLLSDFRVFAPSHPDLTGVKTTAGDYNQGQLGDVMAEGQMVADVVKTWLEKGEARPTLCFAVDRAHAKALQGDFERAGVPTGYVDAYTDEIERALVQSRFERGQIKVVCNVGCLTTGVDWDVRCIILARPTKSEMLYCLDAETEILTSHGWKGMGQVKAGDCAAALADDQTGRGCWSRVLATVERDMDPTEKWVEYSAPRANFRVTDQHTMIAASGNDKGRAFKRISAANMAEMKGGACTPTAVRIDQPGVPLTDAELYFVGMMMADGTWTHTTGSISQSDRHPQIVNRIENCLQDCGIGYAKRRVKTCDDGCISERHDRWRFDFSAGKPKAHARIGNGPIPTKTHATHVAGVTGFRHLMPYLDKDMAPALMAMSRSQLDVFLSGLWDGDGSKKKGVDYTPRSMQICSARPLMLDRLQALAAINGYTGNVRKEHGPSRATPIWHITITLQDWRYCGGYASASRNPRPQIEVKPATRERVWCVETEAGTIITRRRGKVTVMGNCQMIGRGLRTADGKDDLLILDHADNTLRMGFVTDIHHDALKDGKREERNARERDEPLPKDCTACGFVKPAKVSECPSCGFKPQRQTDVEIADGDLVEVKGGKRQFTKEQKQEWISGLCWIAADRGYAPGWAAHKYREKFGVWPRGLDETPARPTPEIVNYVKSRQIAFAKKRQKQHA